MKEYPEGKEDEAIQRKIKGKSDRFFFIFEKNRISLRERILRERI